jgi:hypothetical protein
MLAPESPSRGATSTREPLLGRNCICVARLCEQRVRASSGHPSKSDSNVSTTRFILVTLICASPIILLADGLITQDLVACTVAAALVIAARGLRPGESAFLLSIILPLGAAVAVPALLMLIQVLPLRGLAHPIWTSAEKALGHPVAGAISVDPGVSVIALGQYLSTAAVALLSAAVAVDRQRAEWVLFALTAAGAVIALSVLAHDVFFPGVGFGALLQAQAIDCTAMGAIFASAACIRTIERYETRRSSPQRSVPTLLRTGAASAVALAICAAALILSATYWTLFASACGLAALACVSIIRRFTPEPWGAAMIAAPALGGVLLLLAYHPPERGRSLPLVLAPILAPAPSASLTALSERVLADAPLVGTGAGTFASVAPIYREIDDPPPGPTAPTAAAAVAIEVGKPMFFLIAVATAAAIFILLRASLRRGRDSFYAAMAGSCLITLLLLAFTNAGPLGTATSLIVAAALGLGFAQSKSRTPQP